jgi:flagella basal body P-ring formation protein FlgA
MKCINKPTRLLAKSAVFPLFLFWFVTSAHAAASAACLVVEGDQISAGDLAKIDPAFGAVHPLETISYAPAPGQQRAISKAEWLSWAAAKKVGSSWSAETVCIERAAATLDRTTVQAAMSQAFGNESSGPQIQVVDVCTCVVPKGKLVFPLSGASAPPSREPQSPVIWRGYVETPSGRAYPVWAHVTAVLHVQEVAAARPLLAGRTITESDLIRKEVLDSPFRVRDPRDLTFYVGKSLVQSVKIGSLLTPQMVESGNVIVHRGSLVTVEVLNGPLRLELNARAETGGSKGDEIQLTNLHGLRRFRATVTGPNHASIMLDAPKSEEEISDGAVSTPLKGNQ